MVWHRQILGVLPFASPSKRGNGLNVIETFVSSAELLCEQGAVERHVRGRHLPPLSHHHGYCGLRLSVGGA